MKPTKLRPHYTTPVSEIERSDCETLIRLALDEDAPAGDVTSESIFSETEQGRARIAARENGVLCGAKVVAILLDIDAERSGARVDLHLRLNDGDAFQPGDNLLELRGPLRALLRLERPILNFLQYLSGISTVVAAAVAQAGPDIAVLDTRKTLPGYRRLAKYAVYCGGGTNHRISLSDMAMIKDNHVAAAGGVREAARRVRAREPAAPLEIEIDSLDQLDDALAAAPRAILLDNMDRPALMRAIERIRAAGAAKPAGALPLIEVSGGWTPERLKDLQGLGPLGVSMGFLTHTTRFLDLSLEYVSET